MPVTPIAAVIAVQAVASAAHISAVYGSESPIVDCMMLLLFVLWPWLVVFCMFKYFEAKQREEFERHLRSTLKHKDCQ